MKLYTATTTTLLPLLGLLSSNTLVVVVHAQITRSTCVQQGGQVVGDIGNGAIFQANYQCDNSGQAPTDTVIPDGVDGEAFAADGEVCCGGTGSGIGSTGGGTFGGPTDGGPFCTSDSDCAPIQCFVPPCPASICLDGACDVEPNPPNPECVQDKDCPPINCFAAPCDVNVCNAGICELQPPSDLQEFSEGLVPNELVATRQECEEDYHGVVVGDIGNGAIHQPDYLCESNGEPPVATIVPAEGEPIAFEGEVCCGASVGRPTATRQECTGELNGMIVGDIGNGAIHAPDYVCESNGEPPLADIVPVEGETIAIEGEVCCGVAQGVTDDSTLAPTVTPTETATSETTSAAGDSMATGSAAVATAIAFGALVAETFVDFFIEDAWDF